MPWMRQLPGCSPARFTSPGVEVPHLCSPDPLSLLSLTLCLWQQSRLWESLMACS